MNKEIEREVKPSTFTSKTKRVTLLIALITGGSCFALWADHYGLFKPTPLTPESTIALLPEPQPAPVSAEIIESPPYSGPCSFLDRDLPSNMVVVAAGAYSGRPLNYQIDQSGHQATQFDVGVNSKKPVALILGAYEPSVWNIRWTKNTAIKAIYVTGYHRQVVAGVPPDLPIINSSFKNKSVCGYNYVGSDENSLSWINPKAMSVFGTKVQRVYPSVQGHVFINEPTGASEDSANYSFVTYEQNKPESYFDKNAPLAGKAGLDDAVSKGIIRPLTPSDMALVRAHYEIIAKKSYGNSSVPPIAGRTNTETVAANVPHIFNGYAVLKPFNIPAGLYGGNSASFVVMPGVTYPNGNPGHGIIINLNDYKNVCEGVLCNH